MDLWIRSQSRERLTKVEKLGIVTDYSQNICYVTNGVYDIGTYKTKEKCLEILDEIQSLLAYKPLVANNSADMCKEWFNHTHFIATNENTIQPLGIMVYEMPKE